MSFRVFRKPDFFVQSLLFLLFAILFEFSEQQLAKPKPSQELAYCLSNPTTENNIKSFWHAASSNCPNDPHKLLDLYDALKRKPLNSKCDKLLKHQLGKTLIETCSLIYEDAIVSGSFRNDSEIERLTTKISSIDDFLSQMIWERTIDAVYMFVGKLELAQLIFELPHFNTKAVTLIYLRLKQIWRSEESIEVLKEMAMYFKALQDHKNFKKLRLETQRHIFKMYASLPKQLIMLFNSKSPVRLLNLAQSEFLYAPREIGPDAIRRMPLTWIKEKNSTDSDGDFILESNFDGTFKIGSFYDGKLRYLYLEYEPLEPFFWLKDEGINESGKFVRLWWYLDWFEAGDYYTITNTFTGDRLCALDEYDENRRFVRIKPAEKAAEYCHWRIINN